MAAPAFNDTLFRQQVPAMADTTAYPTALLTAYWGVANDFITASGNPCAMLRDDSLVLALNLMTAHICALMQQDAANAEAGDQPGLPNGIETSASVGSVSVGVMQPPVDNMWGYWLAQTQYGQMLLALLKVKSVGGIYVGGRPESAAFRKAFGRF